MYGTIQMEIRNNTDASCLAFGILEEFRSAQIKELDNDLQIRTPTLHLPVFTFFKLVRTTHYRHSPESAIPQNNGYHTEF